MHIAEKDTDFSVETILKTIQTLDYFIFILYISINIYWNDSSRAAIEEIGKSTYS